MSADSAPVVPPASTSGDEKPAKKTKAKRYPRPNVCLDYLKGQCSAKRFQCKYQHPDLVGLQHQLDEAQSGTEKEVCEVWTLTGRCKFGAKCNKLHPPVHPSAAAAATDGLTRRERRRRGEGAEGAQADAEVEFRAFADSLLTPFSGVDIDPVEPADPAEAPAAPEEATAEPHALDGLEAILGKAGANFDAIFLDILNDLHLTATSM